MAGKLSFSALLLVALSFTGANAQEISGCGYRDKSLEGTYMRSDQCGLIGEAMTYLAPELLDKIYFDADGLSCVWFGQEHRFWIRRDAKSMRVPNWGGDCANFQQGLAVAQLAGRQAYIDTSLQVVLDPGFEFLGAFEEGYARACNGPFTHERNGENTRTTGGSCGMIDRSGKLVMDLVHPAEDFVPFRDFRNANNHCPAPPIEDESAALCHARRHAMGQYWTSHSVERVGDAWEVLYSFLSRGRERTNLIELGREKAEVRQHGREDLRRR
jgi:hypothetical protein